MLRALAPVLGVGRNLDMCRTAISVCCDLATPRLMGFWVGGQTGAGQQLRAEARRETVRARTGADVLTASRPEGA
jgi:Na+/H+-dicarboxylate symporter